MIMSEESRKKEAAATRTVTYGVNGLMEWWVDIPTGSKQKPMLKVRFEGGQITGYGVAPARFTTADPVVQHLIENSKYFRTGRIFKVR